MNQPANQPNQPTMQPHVQNAKRKSTEDAVPSVRTCPRCLAVFRPTLPRCPACGAEVIIESRPSIEVRAGELSEVVPGWRRYGERASDDQRLRSLSRWCAEAAAKGYKPGWIGNKHRMIFGRWPSSADLAAARSMPVEVRA